jgi:hypothetical protein
MNFQKIKMFISRAMGSKNKPKPSITISFDIGSDLSLPVIGNQFFTSIKQTKIFIDHVGRLPSKKVLKKVIKSRKLSLIDRIGSPPNNT